MASRVTTAIGIALIAGGVVCTVDALARDRLFVRSSGDMSRYARLLVSENAQGPFTCRTTRQTDVRQLSTLMRAITLVESHAASGLERLVESATVHAFSLIGLTPPDLSIGPAQIRLSTAVEALADNENLLQTGNLSGRGVLATELLDDCGSHRVGIAILSTIANQAEIDGRALSKRDIHTIAARYNAAGEGADATGAVAIGLYQRLVFHVYQELRFASLVRDEE